MIGTTQPVRMMALVVLLCTTGAFAQSDSATPNSGFLGGADIYARLQPVKAEHGQDAKRWIDPSLRAGQYTAVLIDPVVLYPKPEPSEDVSAETLDQIRGYLTQELKSHIGGDVTLVESAGPGVLHMEAALTGIVVKPQGLKPRDIVPVAALFTGLKHLAGKSNQEVHVFIEVKFLDGQSGNLEAAAMREVGGKTLHGKKEQLTLDDVKKSLDEASAAGAAAVSAVMKGGASAAASES